MIPLSLLDTLLPDEGLMGARQAITENQTTGRFLGHEYALAEVVVPADGDLVAAFEDALAAGQRLFILDLQRRADPGARRPAGGGGCAAVQRPRAGRPAAPRRLPARTCST